MNRRLNANAACSVERELATLKISSWGQDDWTKWRRSEMPDHRKQKAVGQCTSIWPIIIFSPPLPITSVHSATQCLFTYVLYGVAYYHCSYCNQFLCHSILLFDPFPLGGILRWALANPRCVPNMIALASTVAEILKGKPLISRSFPSPGQHPLFLIVGFDDGPWQTPAACQIWSRWLHLLRKYKGIF